MASVDEFENGNLSDHANVAISPPLLFGILLIIGCGLRVLVPMPFLPDRLAWIGGPIIVVAALALAVWAVRTMRAGGGIHSYLGIDRRHRANRSVQVLA